MSFEVSKEAAIWYKNELDLSDGDFVQFYVQLYGGMPTSHPNFYLGISVGRENHIAIKSVVEGITFYFTEDHSWVLDDYNMKIDLENGDITVNLEEK